MRPCGVPPLADNVTLRWKRRCYHSVLLLTVGGDVAADDTEETSTLTWAVGGVERDESKKHRTERTGHVTWPQGPANLSHLFTVSFKYTCLDLEILLLYVTDQINVNVICVGLKVSDDTSNLNIRSLQYMETSNYHQTFEFLHV